MRTRNTSAEDAFSLYPNYKNTRMISKLSGKSQSTPKNTESSSTSDSQGSIETKSKTHIRASVRGIKLTPGKGRKSHDTAKNLKSSNSSDSQAKPKPPVWASVKDIKITPGKRKSFRINSDTYDFPNSPNKEKAQVKRNKITKPRKQIKKKMRPRTKLRLLTTDPSWQGTASKDMPFLGASSTSSTTRKTTASSGYTRCYNSFASDGGDEASIPSIMSSIRHEESTNEFTGFDLEDSCDSNDIFLGFEGETRSSFVVPDKNKKKKEVVPMTSVSVLPTPTVSKHISKYIGGSSTPRMENTALPADNQETVAINDSIAQCFGFESEPEEESELNISPVQQSRSRQALEVTGTSDMTDGELHPATLPSRFSWSSLRPGYQSKASTSRSSSMVAQGGSTNMTDLSCNSQVMGGAPRPFRFTLNRTDLSHKSQAKITSFTVPSVAKQHPRKAKGKTSRQDQLQHTAHKESESCDTNAAEETVLFDENELLEKQSTEEKNLSQASDARNNISMSVAEPSNHSPKKHFPKAPRKSYDRKSLLEARRKFIEMHGGFAEPEDDTEEEEEEAQASHQTKNRKKPTKVTKKKENKQVKAAKGGSEKTNASISMKKKKNDEFDATVDEWASRLNNHFSEVEESFLLLE